MLLCLTGTCQAAKHWSGSAWVDTTVKYGNGTAWVTATEYRGDGTTWIALETPPAGSTVLIGLPDLVVTKYISSATTTGSMHKQLTAVASGKLTKGYAATYDATSTDHVKMCVWLAKVLIECSAEVDVPTTGGTDSEFTFAGTYDIVSGTEYQLGVIGKRNPQLGTDNTTYGLKQASNSYTTPVNIVSENTNSSWGRPRIWVTN
jgi:hypothetical protein